jgi:hypothetical protein
LLVAGGVFTGVLFYGAAVAYGTAAIARPGACKQAAWMLVPLAGPVVVANAYADATTDACDDPEGLSRGVVTMLGIGEGVGVVLAGIGLALQSSNAPPSKPVNATSTFVMGRWQDLRVVPLQLDRSGAELGVIGAF